MAKTPAINWYFDNWTGGTLGMNRFHKGCYMDLLAAQFQLGHLSLEQIKNILGADFAAWETLKSKFLQDECGNFFNERLAAEIMKRTGVSKIRSYSAKKRWGDANAHAKAYPNAMQKHMLYNEIEIENRDIGGLGEKGMRPWNQNPIATDVGDLPKPNLEAIKVRIHQANGFAPPDAVILRYWEAWKVETLTGNKFYASLHDVYKHFSNTAKDQKFKQPEQEQQQTIKKPTGAEIAAKYRR